MTRWYAEYFTADYWSFARHEYTRERTAAETAYLLQVLGEHAPGRRLLDLGCGTGRHAVELARHGYRVTGVDVCAWALEQARSAAAREGVRVGLIEGDLLERVELPEADAAICVQAFGWGRDDEQLALLRRVRERLVPGGLLVLDHSNVAAILSRYRARDRFEAAGDTFDFLRSYDPLDGRSRGELRVAHADGRVAVLRDDVRLYLPSEVVSLVRAAGFELVRADAGFTAGAAVQPETRYVQILAVAAPRPRPAVLGHRGRGAEVDLRWAPDEIDFVRDAIDDAWAAVGDPREPARAYSLDDPYGSGSAAPVLARHFGVPLDPGQVVTGAGTTGLLHALAGPGRLLHTAHAHPDLPAWSAQRGAELRVFTPGQDVAGERPTTVLLERPGVRGDVLPLEQVAELAEAAAAAGGMLVVDEACANYLGPRASAVPLTTRVPGLVVLRSLSKGYCCGGLRAGFAMCSPDVAGAVRQAVPPLGTSALSLEVALRLLDQGDVLAPLRQAVAAAKPELVEMLSGLGCRVERGHPALPWVVTEDELPPWLAGRRLPGLTRVSVPLSAVRRAALRRAAA
ncbi:aminotransferase class I/II-fold pyridoxal phosphate-dependent enzyme [Nonomuraea ferruginea]|uniref:Aminotransferase class I/II-fold pyridoxal phosphate-dependent enzyme n=1 Tax=Nonomuraea ferruginea TaxID=46174 RepID=A0ABT4SY53_9ACTN|nr:aminotransferase class I/II-fold pyridoxal phosphate-dependent enzyme [Nonomuraea ferruginea]MDA0642159.1 aminotransferase class I/II-fold pyridoxal phosphate-dependent enzyme [Nonomuraea ferruginea]